MSLTDQLFPLSPLGEKSQGPGVGEVGSCGRQRRSWLTNRIVRVTQAFPPLLPPHPPAAFWNPPSHPELISVNSNPSPTATLSRQDLPGLRAGRKNKSETEASGHSPSESGSFLWPKALLCPKDPHWSPPHPHSGPEANKNFLPSS